MPINFLEWPFIDIGLNEKICCIKQSVPRINVFKVNLENTLLTSSWFIIC